MKYGLLTQMNKLLLLIWILALFCGGVQAAQAATNTYNVQLYFNEPQCAPRDSVFLGTFDYDDVTKTVTNLKGFLSESMTGNGSVAFDPVAGPGNSDTMVWLGLDNVSNAIWGATQSYQGTTYTQAQIQALHVTYNIASAAGGLNNQLLPSWTATDNNPANLGAPLGGTFAITFRNSNTSTFCSSLMCGSPADNWSPQTGVAVGGVYAGFPVKKNNPGNASALIFVPDSLSPANTTGNPLILTWNESTLTGDKGLAHTAYTDFVPTVHPTGSYDFGGGMMGAVGMTGTSAYAYGAVGTMSGVPYKQVITLVDTVPDSFTFTSQTGVAINTVIESNSITVSGLAAPSLISVSGGEYAISTDGTNWSSYSTSIPTTVENGNLVKVRQTSSVTPGATTVTILTIGGVSSTFSVTTADGIPDVFNFTPLTGVDPATAYESDVITLSGINTSTAISISTSGTYSVSTDNGATWSAYSASTPATVSNGDQVKVKRTSAATANTATVTTLTIGGVTGNFSITTNAYIAPPTWMPMTMLNISLANGQLAIQELATKSPFNTVPPTYPVLSNVAQGNTYDPGKPWNVLNGKAFSRRLGWNPAAGMNAAAVTAAFGPTASIWIERLSSSAGFETYQAVGSYGVNANNTTTIDPAANGYAPIFGTAGSSTKWKWDYMMDHNTNAVPAAYITTPGQQFSATYRIYVGDSTTGEDIAPAAAYTTIWGWTGPATVPDNIPDPFSFTSQTGVALNSLVESDSITLSGIDSTALISITGGEYSISTNGGTVWSGYSTTTPATVANSSMVKVRQTSSVSYSTMTAATLTIGGVASDFNVTTVATPVDTVPDSFTFTAVTNADPATVYTSNSITVSGINAPAAISVSSGYYAVSTDTGSTWGDWTSSVDTVPNNSLVKVRLTSATARNSVATAMLTIGGVTGSFSVTTKPYSSAPDWMPMTMLDISFDAGASKLAITPTTFAAPLSTNTNMMGMPAAGVAAFDPAQPYAVLNGTAFSRRFGWNDPGYMMGGMPAEDPTSIVYQIKSIYGPSAEIWIQSLAKSPGLNSYQAVGADGLQMGNTYPGIFGTAASSAKWKWDGMMDHNTYAVPFSSITRPNQYFSAYYKIYIGDSAGNDVAPSASIDTTWGWQGPAFVFTSQTGVATGTLIESDVYTHTDASSSIAISGTRGEYTISTDGGAIWSAWTAAVGTINTNDKVKVRQTSSASPGTTTTVQLAIPDAVGPGTFSVTTLGPVTTPTAFSFTSQTGVALSTYIESSTVTVAGINAPTSISINAGGEYSVSTDGGATWSAYTAAPATVANGNRVKVRLVSSSNPGVTTSTTLNIGGSTAAFVVTTGNPVTPSLFFTSITNAPANTNMSGMPFYVTSNAIAVTADSTISVAGGITPQYQVSTDGGVSWSAWSTTAPATVATGNQVRVRVVPANTPFTTSTTNLNMGSTVASFSVTTGYMNPPSWMPMAMLNVAFNNGANSLSVQDEATHPSFSGGALPALTYIPAGSYDPTKPWSILNGGVAISRQLGWDDNTALHGSGITVPGNLLNQVRAAYGATASIWIECTAKSAGLETYFADGMFGVGGTSSGVLAGTPQPYSNMMTGLPIIYANNYYGIFGTDGSSTKWQWDGTMIHNVYAVPAAYITQPNQLFTATYRVYIGDSSTGEDLAPAAATTEVWTWKGPATVPDNVPDAFSFTSQTGVAVNTAIESNSATVSGIAVPALISITGGEYAVSTDGGSTWSAWSTSTPATVANGNLVKVRLTSSVTPGTTTTATLTIGGVAASFSVTTMPPVAVPNVVGLTQAAAQSAVTAATLSNGTVTLVYSSTVAAGLVISQTPSASTSVLPGTVVDLVVSNGPTPVAVPNVVGQGQTDAQTAITSANLTVGSVTQAYIDTVPAGAIISQNPRAGSFVAPGTAVNLVVSIGSVKVYIDPPDNGYFTTISAAFAAASNNATLKLRDMFFAEDLDFNIDKTVVVKGGFNAGYMSNPGYSTLNGALTISLGSVTIENLIIR